VELSETLAEAVQHIRSALDETVTELVRANGGDTAGRRGAFPLAATLDKYPRDVALKGVLEEARRVIDGFQPFAGPEPQHHPLALLRDLSDAKPRGGQPETTVLRGIALAYVDRVAETITVHAPSHASTHRRAGRAGLHDGDNLWELVAPEDLAEVMGLYAKEGREIRDPRRELLLLPRLGVGFRGGPSLVAWPDLVDILDFAERQVLPRLAPFITQD
jgi:hypothetical protein